MSERTGGHHLDTGEGPVQLDAAEPPTSAERWSAYQSHRRGCPQCQTSVFRCTDGEALWNTVIGP